MKMVSHVNVPVEKSDAPALLSRKVCMHVLGIVRTDPRVMREASALAEAGYAVTIVDLEAKGTCPAEEKIDGVYVKHVFMPDSFFSARLQRRALITAAQLFVRSALRLIQTPADVYHAHDVTALPACYIAALFRRKPLIFDAHEMPLAERPLSEMSRSRRWLHTFLAVLFTFLIKRCTGIITVSPPIVQEMSKRYHIPTITLVRNVPVYRAVAKSDRLRQRLGLSANIRIALYQGNLQPDRGLDRLVRAAAFLEQDIVIVMMGKNAKTTQAQLEALIASEGVADRVKILPPVPYTELLDWTASADIGLNVASADHSLNVRYFLPNKFFEYLMAGLPVLTSPLEAMVDVVNTYDVGHVLSSLAPADIGEAINKMLADPGDLARKHSNALEAARSEFYWERKVCSLFTSIKAPCKVEYRG